MEANFAIGLSDQTEVIAVFGQPDTRFDIVTPDEIDDSQSETNDYKDEPNKTPEDKQDSKDKQNNPNNFPILDGVLYPLVLANAEVVAPCKWMGGEKVTLTVAMVNYYQTMTEENALQIVAEVQEFIASAVQDHENEEVEAEKPVEEEPDEPEAEKIKASEKIKNENKSKKTEKPESDAKLKIEVELEANKPKQPLINLPSSGNTENKLPEALVTKPVVNETPPQMSQSEITAKPVSKKPAVVPSYDLRQVEPIEIVRKLNIEVEPEATGHDQVITTINTDDEGLDFLPAVSGDENPIDKFDNDLVLTPEEVGPLDYDLEPDGESDEMVENVFDVDKDEQFLAEIPASYENENSEIEEHPPVEANLATTGPENTDKTVNLTDGLISQLSRVVDENEDNVVTEDIMRRLNALAEQIDSNHINPDLETEAEIEEIIIELWEKLGIEYSPAAVAALMAEPAEYKRFIEIIKLSKKTRTKTKLTIRRTQSTALSQTLEISYALGNSALELCQAA